MITKNAAPTLRRALDPFKDLVSEIVVADTGSIDDTKAILSEYGARVVDVPWQDDFSAARNAALEHARTDWIFSLDADEFVTRKTAEQIAAAVKNPNVEAYLVDTINYTTEPDDGTLRTSPPLPDLAPYFFVSTKIRLAVRTLRWSGRVHELLEIDARRKKCRIGKLNGVVYHDGHIHRPQRSGYYHSLARRAFEEGEAHAGIVTVLALEAVRAGNAEEAFALFKKAMEMEPGSPTPIVWLGKILHKNGRSSEALVLLQEGLKKTGGHGSILAEMITIHSELGEKDCVNTLRTLADRICPDDPSVTAALARHSGSASARTPLAGKTS